MNDANDAINNLERMSKAFEKFANKPENYNTEWASTLEQMSWVLYKEAKDLKDINGFMDLTNIFKE